MSKKLASENFGEKIYNRFPKHYREEDVYQDYALKRYLQSASDGGFKFIIEDSNGILDIINPTVNSKKALLALYNQYGLDMFEGIPEEYMRSLLPYLGEAWAKKGSYDVLEFITSTLYGNVITSRYEESTNTIYLSFNIGDQQVKYFPNASQFRRILENFVPFFVSLILVYTYYYEDSAKLSTLGFIDKWKVRDLKTETQNLLSNTDTLRNTIKEIQKENASLGGSVDIDKAQILKKEGEEKSALIPTEVAKSSITHMLESNALLNRMILGKARLGSDTYRYYNYEF